MTRWLVQRVDGSLNVVSSLDGEDTATVITPDVPADFPENKEWDGAAFVSRPPSLSVKEILNLWTPEEQTAILYSGSAELTGRILMLLMKGETIRADDTFYQQTVDLLVSLNLLTESRAERVAAMLPPV